MQWKKMGLILKPNKQYSWIHSHASLPLLVKNKDRLQLYFTTRKENNISVTGVAQLSNDLEVEEIFPQPVLTPGLLGSFDEHGASACSIVKNEDKIYLYYVGWRKCTTVPFHNAMGLAISYDDGKTFIKIGPGPILDRSRTDPYFIGGGHVQKINQNDWVMWYVACNNWKIENGQPQAYYHLKLATSTDGISWNRKGIDVLPLSSNEEKAIAQPCVIIDQEKYKMWYSYQHSKFNYSYRIGYAESYDGITWNRLDKNVGISTSQNDWDGQMICYANVFLHKGKYWMLYNGNKFGESGIGIACFC